MNNFPKLQNRSHKSWRQRPFRGISILILLLLFILAACSPQPETVTVEVTRVVTETVVEEGETIEVTRVVTETIIETVEVEAEDEIEAEAEDEELPSATGSEEDAGPLPPPPDSEPKVSEGRGSTQATELILETAVTLRASQTNPPNNGQPNAPDNAPLISPTELQKWCQLAAKLHKKQCR